MTDGVTYADIEVQVDRRMEDVVFVDGIVHERYKDSEYVLCAAAGSQLGQSFRTLAPNGDLPPVRETFLMRPCESMPEAQARWREEAIRDGIWFESYRQLRKKVEEQWGR